METEKRHSFKPSERVPAPGPLELFPALLPPRQTLARVLDAHLPVAEACLGYLTGELYGADFLFAAFVQRSFHLLEGFLMAFDVGNVIVAAPLVRLQLDNLLRINYLAAGPDVDEMMRYLLDGGEFRKLKDGDGRSLTDKRLCQLASSRIPWIEKVYERSSGWVHFSGAHFGTVVRAGEEPGMIEGAFPMRPEFIPESFWLELLQVMRQATLDVISYLQGWADHKVELAERSSGAGRENQDQ